jgi:hypothetical protein
MKMLPALLFGMGQVVALGLCISSSCLHRRRLLRQNRKW